MRPDWQQLDALAHEQVEATLAALPAPPKADAWPNYARQDTHVLQRLNTALVRSAPADIVRSAASASAAVASPPGPPDPERPRR